MTFYHGSSKSTSRCNKKSQEKYFIALYVIRSIFLKNNSNCPPNKLKKKKLECKESTAIQITKRSKCPKKKQSS